MRFEILKAKFRNGNEISIEKKKEKKKERELRDEGFEKFDS